MAWGRFLESPAVLRFGPEKLFYICLVGIQYQSFNNFENDTMKLSVNEAKLSGLRDRNCATSQQVWSLKYGCLRVRKVTGPFEKRALGLMLIKCTKQIRKTAHSAVNSIATYCTFRLMYRSFKTRLKRLIESVLFNLPCT